MRFLRALLFVNCTPAFFVPSQSSHYDTNNYAFHLLLLVYRDTKTAELPFIAAHVWTYLPEAANYWPLQGDTVVANVLGPLLGRDDLALSTLSAPCYSAVTMDAIALGRWFDAQQQQQCGEATTGQ